MTIRDVRQISEYTVNILALALNTLIILMALTERNPTLKSYSRILIVSSVVDYVFSVGSVLSATSAVVFDGSILLVSESFLVKVVAAYEVHYLLAGIRVFILGCGTYISESLKPLINPHSLSVPLEYYYRYHLVCR